MIKSWPGDKAEGWHIGRLRSKPEPDILGSFSSVGVGTACQAGEAKKSGPDHLEMTSCPIIQDTQCSSLFLFYFTRKPGNSEVGLRFKIIAYSKATNNLNNP